MNNYWHTNYKADQEGPITFHYSLLPHAAFNASDAAKFGMERRQPLLLAESNPSTPPATPLFHLFPSQVLVTSLKPIPGEHSWLIGIYNPADKAQRVSLEWNKNMSVSIRSSNPAGESGSLVRDPEIAPFASDYLRVNGVARK